MALAGGLLVWRRWEFLAQRHSCCFYPWLSPHAGYRIVLVAQGQAAVQIELLPTGRAINFEPGQFGFLSFQAEGLREPNPFTLAGAPSGNGRVVKRLQRSRQHWKSRALFRRITILLRK